MGEPYGPSTPSSQCKVGGLNLTGSVRGHGCVAEGSSIIKFVEDSGEPGNSGTLMYEISPHNGKKTEIIGVYLGTSRVGTGFKLRGRIRRLPNLKDRNFVWSRPVQEQDLEEKVGYNLDGTLRSIKLHSSN